jgi:hypothetical protein
VLPVAALLFAGVVVLGSGPLEDLGLALFVGMIAGAYSSIFIASPILTQLRESEPEMKAYRERVERRRKAAEARATFKTTVIGVPAAAAPTGVAVTSAEAEGSVPDEKPAFTVTTVTASLISSETPGDAARTSDGEMSPAEDAEGATGTARVPSTPTPRAQPSKQARNRRKR